MGNNDRVVFNPVNTVKFWSQKVLPLVYDEALSYYEVLAKLRAKLNEVIEQLNKVPDLVLQTIRDFIKTEEFELIIKGYIEKYALTKVWHDESLTGTGLNDDPLKINIQHDDSIIGKGVIDDLLMINVKHDSSLTGTGVSENPLAINVKHNETLTGTGTDEDPLSIQVKGGSSITGTGTDSDKLEVSIVHDDTLVGLGTEDSPLGVNSGAVGLDKVYHDETLTGDGTQLNPLSVLQSASASGIITIVDDYFTESDINENGFIDATSVIETLYNEGVRFFGFKKGKYIVADWVILDNLADSDYVLLDASVWRYESLRFIQPYTVRLFTDTTVYSLDAENYVRTFKLDITQPRIIDEPSPYFDSLYILNDGANRKLLLANDKTHELTPGGGTSGLTQVYHDGTLIGKGTQSEPLSVVGGGGGGGGYTHARLWDIDLPVHINTFNSVIQNMVDSSETTLYIPYNEYMWEYDGGYFMRNDGIDLIGITDSYSDLPKLIVPPQDDETISRNLFNLNGSCTIKNISFTNIQFDINAVTLNETHEAGETLDIKFENCTFNNCWFLCQVTQPETLFRLTIDRCEFIDSYFQAAYNAFKTYSISIKNSYIELNPGSPRDFLNLAMNSHQQCVCDISNNFIVNSSAATGTSAATIDISAPFGVAETRNSVKIHNNVILHGANGDTSSIYILGIPNVHITDNRIIYTHASPGSGYGDALIAVSTPENAVIRNNVLTATSLPAPTGIKWPLCFIHIDGNRIVVSENIIDDVTGLGELDGLHISDSEDIMILNNYFKGGRIFVPNKYQDADNIMIHGNTMRSIYGSSLNNTSSEIYDIKFNTFTGSNPIPTQLKPAANFNEIDGQMVGTLVAPE